MFRFLALLGSGLVHVPVRRYRRVRGLRLAALVAAGAVGGVAWAQDTSPLRWNTPARGAVAVSSSAQEAVQRAAREGIGVLSPIQLLPVQAPERVPSQALPLEPLPCEMPPADASLDASSEPAGMVVPSDSEAAPLAIECAPGVASIEPPRPSPSYAFGLDTVDVTNNGPVVVVTRHHSSMHPWFSAVGSQQGFSYESGQWMYRDAVGPTVALGNLTANAPVWGSTAPIGGLQLSSGWSGARGVLSEGEFAYSSVVGRLDHTDKAASAGAIDYGVTAGSGALRYGLTPALTLEGQLQSAPDMATRGLGTTYTVGEFGTFRAGATRSEFDQVNAWRYRFGYNVNLTESVSLAVTNEQVDAGFGDLAAYRSGTTVAPVMRNTLAAGVPLHGGTLTGTYTGTSESGTAVEQRFGLEHSSLVAPDVRLALGADRDIISGDYEMRAGITMPVDAFVRGRWLPW